MEKHPKEMTSEELYIKLMKEDIVNVSVASTVREAGIDGGLLWMMVEDFNEFSAIITNPVQRLRLKQFVKNYRKCPNPPAQIPPLFNDVIEDDMESDSEQSIHVDLDNIDYDSDQRIASSPTPNITSKKRYIECEGTLPAKRLALREQQPYAESGVITLPDKFSHKVTIAMETNQLHGGNRSAFVRECVYYFERILPRPSKEDFKDISRRLCDKYPSLKDPKKKEYWSSLKHQISQRYRNLRRRSPASISHKVVFPNNGESSMSIPAAYGDETEEFEENVEALRRIVKMKSPSAQVVQRLLNATRSRRQKWLSSALISIHEIIEKYPVLKNPTWLLYEFNNMMGEDMLETIKINWKSMCEQLLSDPQTSEYAEEKAALQKIEENVNYRKTASPVVITEACGNIDGHFSSQITEPRLIIFEDDGSASQLFVAGEDDSLMELPTNTIGEGIVYLMATYYVFNVQYPRAYQPLLFFFQDFMMDKPDGGKRPTRYCSFAARIKY